MNNFRIIQNGLLSLYNKTTKNSSNNFRKRFQNLQEIRGMM